MYPATSFGYLLQHLAFVLSRRSDEVLQQKLGIGFSQFKILMCLGDTGVVRQRQIAEDLAQTEASVSRQIKLLHDNGFLESKARPGNRREHQTKLTIKGRKAVREAFLILNSYHQPLFERLTPTQLEHFQDILSDMHESACFDSCKLNRSLRGL